MTETYFGNQQHACNNLVELLRLRAEHSGEKLAFSFLLDGELQFTSITYGQLDRRARAIATALNAQGAAGERVLLMYPAGLSFIAGFFGCLYAGALAVPAPPPHPRRQPSRALSICTDSTPRVIMTDSASFEATQSSLLKHGVGQGCVWLASDACDESQANRWNPPAITGEKLACLQYTSGSTRAPAGVMLSHDNLLTNLAMIRTCFGTTEDSHGVFWLPHFHDMGLVGGLLSTIFCGGQATLLSPSAFLQRPLRWLRAASKARATHIGAPNFAYEMCAKALRPDDTVGLDLSSLQVAYNGAEPIAAETLSRFAEAFAPYGFRREALLPTYGLAEATLLVTASPYGRGPLSRQLPTHDNASELPRLRVSCGVPTSTERIFVVDPVSETVCSAGTVGEIWVNGPHVAQGYWGRATESAAVFHARVATDPQGDKYLRTGDLGLLIDGELYVTGRVKDLIVIRGENHYPQDIEATVAACHAALEPMCGAAVAVEVAGQERLVIVQELRREYRRSDPAPIFAAVERAIADHHELQVDAIALIPPGKIPKTSSGKVQRSVCRDQFAKSSLPEATIWTRSIANARGAVTESLEQTAITPMQESIRQWLVAAIAVRKGIAPAELQSHETFAHFGLDSAAIVAIAGELESWLGRRLSPTLLYEFPNIDALSAHLTADFEVASADTSEASPRAPMSSQDIAIVGIGCRVPGARGPAEFWRLLHDGIDATCDAPVRDWMEESTVPLRANNGAVLNFIPNRGGFLESVELFDAQYFGISPREAAAMDPQQRLLLEVAHEALRDAGISADELDNTNTGVFVGIASNDYSRLALACESRELHAGTGNALSIAANRLSYVLNLRGPSMAVDTACSSSLVAAHLACHSVARGECDVAIVGGVNVILDFAITTTFARAGFLAPDGRCKAFSAAANGYARGEGVGVVVLKPLAAALAAGDGIYAVICGTAINQDGRSNGLTAPNPRAQEAVIRAALHNAHISPADVQYVEAHGTGTPLGDPIEARVLGSVLAEGRAPENYAWIGTVKSNIGHLEAAAGVAGLIKTALMLRHRTLVPSLHFAAPNPLIPFDTLPLRVCTTTTAFGSRPNERLVAGVSSFGFGGSNAHVVLTSPPTSAPHDEVSLYPWQWKRHWLTVTRRSDGERTSYLPSESNGHASSADGREPLPAATIQNSPPRPSPAQSEPHSIVAERQPLPNSRMVPSLTDVDSALNYLTHVVAKSLEYQPADFDPHASLVELGIDSMVAVEVVHQVERDLNITLSFANLIGGASLTTLAAELSQTLATQAGRGAEPIPIHVASTLGIDAEIPLSIAQQRLWLLAQLAGPEVLNIPAAVRLTGELKIAAIEESINLVVARQDALRLVMRTVHDRIVQRVLPPQRVALHVLHLSPLAEEQRREEALRLLHEAARRPLDIERGPLLRCTLLRLHEREHYLLLTISHLIGDGWSLGILVREIGEAYAAIIAGRSLSLPALPLRFVDFVVWQRERIGHESQQRAMDYWRSQLAGCMPLLDLPTDHPRPKLQTYAGARRSFSVEPHIAHALWEFGRRHDATAFMVLLAAFQTLLYRWAGQSDFVVGTPALGRIHPQTRDLVGVFLNLLPLRTQLAGDLTFVELVERVRQTSLEAYAHEEVPIEELITQLNLHGDPRRPPVFQTLFDLQDASIRTANVPGLLIEHVEVDPQTSLLDLSLYLVRDGDELRGFFEYNTQLFDAATIDLLVERLRTLLAGIATSPDRRLSELPVLGEHERRRLIHELNATSVSYARERCIHELIEDQVERTPQRVATSFLGEELTYAQLDRRANDLARQLVELGVIPNMPVALCVDRSLEMVVGMLGILKAGGAYVAIDPTNPRARHAAILADSQATIVVTHGRLARRLPEHVRAVQLDAPNHATDGGAQRPPQVPLSSQNLAYILYTSGSTGRPKGVMVSHRNVVNFFAGMSALAPNEEPGVWLAVTTISFDISVLELLWTLSRGFKVVIAPVTQRSASPVQLLPSLRPPMQFSLFYFECDEEQHGRSKYQLVLAGSRFADEHGFTAVWTPERHFHPFGGLYPNPAVVGAAIAATTRHVGIRAGSVVLPLHDPLRVAEEWAVVDGLSGGRVGLAFAPGSHPTDFVFAPDAYAERKPRMLKEIETVRRLWRGDRVRRRGGNGEEVDVAIFPRPVQPELPVWLTSIGADSFRLAGERGYHVLSHLLFHDLRELTEKIVTYRQAWREHGHAGSGHVTLMVHTYVGETLEHVRRQVETPLCNYLRSSADLFVKLGLAKKFNVDTSRFNAEDLEAFVDHAYERFFDFNGLLGTPDTCVTMVETLKAIGVDEVACLIDFGVRSDGVMEGLRQLDRVRQRSNRPLSFGAAENAPPPLSQQILEQGVTHLQCTPAMAQLLLAERDGAEALASLRKLYVGGDALPLPLAQQLAALVPGEVRNMYGPTETTVWSTTAAVAATDDIVVIGRPLANTQVYVLDQQLQPVPAGAVGELFIGGDGVARGYYRRDDLTAERFLPDPFRAGTTARLYRTGDQVRFRVDGALEFLGRLDQQVKVRGYRIELGEIEAVLADFPGVRQAAVVARTESSGDKQLIAFVVGDAGIDCDAALTASLRNRLPPYMIPSRITQIDSLPLNSSQKIDRAGLLALASAQSTAAVRNVGHLAAGSRNDSDYSQTRTANVATPPVAEFSKWRTPTERSLVQLWRGVLETERPIGIHDDFFALGGHSLQAAMVVTRIREIFRVDVPLRDLFETRTIAALSEKIDAYQSNSLSHSSEKAAIEQK